MNFTTEVLNANHLRKEFTCGENLLDRYIREQARQDIETKVAVCFILSVNTRDIEGFYTLSNDSIPRNMLPDKFLKKLPKYKSLPVTMLGRLAVAQHLQGQGLRQHLLMDALHRSLIASESVGSHAVVVDPLNDSAQAFYLKFDFQVLPDSGKMFLPMKSIRLIFR